MKETIVDIWFRVRGTSVPSLHAHELYGAVTGVVTSGHGAPWLGIHTLRGQRDGDGRIWLKRGTRLGLRLPSDKVPLALQLAGRTLTLKDSRLVVGVPEIHPLTPNPCLSARMVTIKGFEQADGFQLACLRQLEKLGVHGDLAPIDPEKDRLVQAIHRRKIVGFAVRIRGLSSEDSLRLQVDGIGGRRRFGCGLFRPSRWGAA